MSGHSLLIASIEKHLSLNTQEQHRILLAFTTQHIKKKEFFLRAGEVCKQVAFVLNGCMRSYAVDEQGFEHNLQFAPEGWWIMTVELGRANRLPLVPAASRKAPIDAAMPMHYITPQ